MRTLALAVLTMVTAFGATQADAQGFGGRLGGARPMPGASYPMPGSMPVMPQPGAGMPGNMPPSPMPPRPYPGQMNGPRPMQGGGWQSSGGSRWGGSVSGHWSGGMNAPGGWNAYRRRSRGHTLPNYWLSPNFYIGDFGVYNLYAPPQGYGWQRYYDDAVLVDGRGRVRDSVYGLDWDGGYGQDGGYASGDYAYAQDGAGGQGYGYQGQYHGGQYRSLPPVSRQGNVTTYSTGGYDGGYAQGGYYYPGATTTVVTIQSAPSVTTTTTEYVEETTRTRYVAPRRAYVKKRYYRPARVRCSCRHRAPVEQPILGS